MKDWTFRDQLGVVSSSLQDSSLQVPALFFTSGVLLGVGSTSHGYGEWIPVVLGIVGTVLSMYLWIEDRFWTVIDTASKTRCGRPPALFPQGEIAISSEDFSDATIKLLAEMVKRSNDRQKEG